MLKLKPKRQKITCFLLQATIDDILDTTFKKKVCAIAISKLLNELIILDICLGNRYKEWNLFFFLTLFFFFGHSSKSIWSIGSSNNFISNHKS